MLKINVWVTGGCITPFITPFITPKCSGDHDMFLKVFKCFHLTGTFMSSALLTNIYTFPLMYASID